jgi:DNA-binding NarL/FixJ family response regulator
MLTVEEDADHIFDALAARPSVYLVKRTPREALITALRAGSSAGYRRENASERIRSVRREGSATGIAPYDWAIYLEAYGI